MSSPPPTQDRVFRLVKAVQELSLARSVDRVREIVRQAARSMSGADGATFVLKDGPNCHYVDEDAIGPLWKGKRFPLETCISGWVMKQGQSVVIPDIYCDSRVPVDAYRPTFVKSLAMVPIRRASPIGAIGIYWASTHSATSQEVELLQALADSTSVAMENVQVYAELEQRVKDRTAELEQANRDLGSFSSAVSHDLRAPVRHVAGYAAMLSELLPANAKAEDLLNKIQGSAARMNELIEDMLKLAKISQANLTRIRLDLSTIAQEIAAGYQTAEPDRQVQVVITPGVETSGDPGLVRIALENLIGNAWKFTAKRPVGEIHFGVNPSHPQEYFVRDNGNGFEMRFADRLFQPFARLHSQTEFAGNGIGLATVRRIVEKHGGGIRAESTVDRGTAFYFTLGEAEKHRNLSRP